MKERLEKLKEGIAEICGKCISSSRDNKQSTCRGTEGRECERERYCAGSFRELIAALPLSKLKKLQF